MLTTRTSLLTFRTINPILRPNRCLCSSKLPLQRSNLSTSSSFSASALHNLRKSLQKLGIQVRFDTTVANPTATLSSATNSIQPLTWNRFLQLRKIRRRLSVGASIICALGAFITGVGYISSHPEVETIVNSYIGLDPFITMGLLTFAFGALGWLSGPFAAGLIFSLRYRSMTKLIAEKEKEFFARIAKYRVDPTTSSLSNPVPDYYGEKIGSVVDYRRWLKDQRAFNLKREKLL